MLARAKREGWTRQIAQAKAKATAPDAMQSGAITVMQSAAITMAERGQRHVERMAGVAEKVVPHVEAMAPGEILDRIERVERFDKLARRTFGIDDDTARQALVNLNFMSVRPDFLEGLPQAPPELELPEWDANAENPVAESLPNRLRFRAFPRGCLRNAFSSLIACEG